jgi:serine/threonine protein kinase
MGLVYRAHDERLDRKVAIKLLPEHVAGDAEHRARMMAEARAASALNHPSIVTIHEVGEDGEKLFIVMELVTGETLRSALATGAMDAKPLVRLGAQIAEVLSVAHGQGVVHGDVKPENIMVQPDGRVKLLDFGIARRVLTETLTLTRASLASDAAGGAIAGTLAYMAPETLRGDRSDSRADLFSLGVVLYELAAGLRPFPGPTTTAVVNQILNEAPGPLTGWVPPELARIVHRLLEKRPELRYQTAREVQIDLINLARNLDLGTLPAAVACKR